MNSYIDYTNLFRDVVIDIVSLYFFSYRILYKRYLNKELFVTCSLFNIFLLLVIMALVRTSFTVALGFGLFALLSMVTLRSTTFTKAEMAYVFGSVALAVINGAGITDLVFVFTCNVIIILSALVISAWSLEHSANIMEVDNIKKLSVTLDRIDMDALNNHQVMKDKLRRMYNLDIIDFTTRRVDYVRDLMIINIAYRIGALIPGSADQAGLLLHAGTHAGNGALLGEESLSGNGAVLCEETTSGNGAVRDEKTNPSALLGVGTNAGNGAVRDEKTNPSNLPGEETNAGSGALAIQKAAASSR